jgi:hypothetical protein
MGKFVREKRKIRKKFGELRSTFACLSSLVPASPLAGDQQSFNSTLVVFCECRVFLNIFFLLEFHITVSDYAIDVIARTPAPPAPAGRYETISEKVAPSYLDAKVGLRKTPTKFE